MVHGQTTVPVKKAAELLQQFSGLPRFGGLSVKLGHRSGCVFRNAAGR